MPSKLPNSCNRRNLLVDFASLKQVCPSDVFVSLVPGDPSRWTGVLFVRKGPYAQAVLRFTITFPPTYPSTPPLIVFSTDIFHPLVTPLTTYTYTTTHQTDTDTVSSADDERLPPGGFSLRHGFPAWFGRTNLPRRSVQSSTASSRNVSAGEGATMGGGVQDRAVALGSVPVGEPLAEGMGSTRVQEAVEPDRSGPEQMGSAEGEKASLRTAAGSPSPARTVVQPGHEGAQQQPPTETLKVSKNTRQPTISGPEHPTIQELLLYIRSAFDTPSVLDQVPLSAAGNPGAWHAWRSYRAKKAGIQERSRESGGSAASGSSTRGEGTVTPTAGGLTGVVPAASGLVGAAQGQGQGQARTRRPGEWNWEGVWKERVRKGVQRSLEEGMLFGAGGSGGDDMIRFLDVGEDGYAKIVEDIRRRAEGTV